jgi:hypothetical protein
MKSLRIIVASFVGMLGVAGSAHAQSVAQVGNVALSCTQASSTAATCTASAGIVTGSQTMPANAFDWTATNLTVSQVSVNAATITCPSASLTNTSTHKVKVTSGNASAELALACN